MSNKKLFVGAAAVVLFAIAVFALGSSGKKEVKVETANLGLGSSVLNTVYTFTQGIDTGAGAVQFTRGGTIGAGQNQAFWRNTTGRTVMLVPELTSVGFNTGTASSSMIIYVATSSSSTISNDYAQPGGLVRALDGAIFATSTAGPRFFMGTTTSLGTVPVVRDGEYVVVQIQDRYGCKTVGVCETATSTNRGITNFIWRITGFYRP